MKLCLNNPHGHYNELFLLSNDYDSLHDCGFRDDDDCGFRDDDCGDAQSGITRYFMCYSSQLKEKPLPPTIELWRNLRSSKSSL